MKRYSSEMRRSLASTLCGNVMKIPFYRRSRPGTSTCAVNATRSTGKQRDVATGGRVDRFNKRFSVPGTSKVILLKKPPQGRLFCLCFTEDSGIDSDAFILFYRLHHASRRQF